VRLVGSVVPFFASTSQTPPASPWCSVSQLCHARASGTVNIGESAATRLSLHERVVYVLQPSLRLSNGPVRRVPGALHENQVHHAITSNCYVRLENWRP
jgi:hypothetical protein